MTDAWDKRGRKGYLFIIGDELNKPRLRAWHIQSVIGDHAVKDLDVANLYREVQQRGEAFFVLPRQTWYFDDADVNRHWPVILGERLLKLEDPHEVSDLIALTIGLLEDTIDLEQGLADLRRCGSRHGHAVGTALGTVGRRRIPRSISASVVRRALPAGGDRR